MSWRWVVAALCVSGCDGPSDFTAPPDRGHSLSGPVSPPPLHDVVQKHAEELGIGPEKVEVIRRLAGDARSTLDGYHQDIDRAREHLRTLLAAPRPDRGAVRAAVQALGDAETKLRLGEIDVMLDILAHLEPKQREALGRKVQRRRRRHPSAPRPRHKPRDRE